jgi:hypothetical protein
MRYRDDRGYDDRHDGAQRNTLTDPDTEGMEAKDRLRRRQEDAVVRWKIKTPHLAEPAQAADYVACPDDNALCFWAGIWGWNQTNPATDRSKCLSADGWLGSSTAAANKGESNKWSASIPC